MSHKMNPMSTPLPTTSTPHTRASQHFPSRDSRSKFAVAGAVRHPSHGRKPPEVTGYLLGCRRSAHGRNAASGSKSRKGSWRWRDTTAEPRVYPARGLGAAPALRVQLRWVDRRSRLDQSSDRRNARCPGGFGFRGFSFLRQVYVRATLATAPLAAGWFRPLAPLRTTSGGTKAGTFSQRSPFWHDRRREAKQDGPPAFPLRCQTTGEGIVRTLVNLGFSSVSLSTSCPRTRTSRSRRAKRAPRFLDASDG